MIEFHFHSTTTLHQVFVTRISETLTKEDLQAYFQQFGELTDIFVPLKNPMNQYDDSHKGGFVRFKLNVLNSCCTASAATFVIVFVVNSTSKSKLMKLLSLSFFKPSAGIAFVSFKDLETFEEVLSRDKYEIKPDTFIVVDKAAGKGGGGGKGKGKKGKKGKDKDGMGGPPQHAGMYGGPQMPMPGMGSIGPPGELLIMLKDASFV